MLRTILKKLDGIKKGWKRFTTSMVFVGLTTICATKGIDLAQHVEHVEAVYASLAAAYATFMGVFQVADAAGKS